MNLIISLYLDFTELQTIKGRLMKMKGWISKLDDFLKLSERKLLNNAGTVSAEQSAQKAEAEFEKYHKEQEKNYVSDFDRAVKALEKNHRKQSKKNV